ncbi:MAG TPA: threonine--tRNA ligase [Candidatus Sumerlaeota bacterium]|nr:threonine--tRNA ligase [Candidatus Sumerlaeota bacterium]
MNIKITFPDGKIQEYASGVTPAEIAAQIGPGLARAALAASLDGQLVDMNAPLKSDGALRFVTFQDPEGKDIYRHSSSHIMAQAIRRIWPEAALAIGPAIADGFYYDIALPQPISTEDLPRIEEEMERIVREDLPFSRVEVPREEALEIFRKQGNKFKEEIISELPVDATVSLYRQGEFVDLCRGPHIPSTKYLKAFKLTAVAGAYWRGDEKRDMLTRIYGTSFSDKKDLKEHLQLLEEARKRDHRKLGKELGLFTFHQEGPGFPFFHPRGVVLYNTLTGFCREELQKRNYREVRTPIILHEQLWHQSGHWDHYKENMYFTTIDERQFAVKPMNCPGGLLIYKSTHHSYREFPIRVGEFGLVHRHEKSGVLHGLFRVRAFTQDDAHVFCLPEQLEDEIRGLVDLILYFYKVFGFEDVHIELSTRPEKSIGTDEVWEKATSALQNTLEHMNIVYKLNPGDGAFYGPKIDFHIRDCLKRTWQCATIQVDFSMPERFDLTYVGADGQEHRPVMVHRAVFGSLERFMGILIEHYAGNFPLWLAPVQVMVLPIGGEQEAWALELIAMLRAAGIRAEIDLSSEKIGRKIRDAEIQKIPCMLVIGQREADGHSAAIRRHGAGDQGVKAAEELIRDLLAEIAEKRLHP